MTKLEQLQKSVAELGEEELRAFTAWFEDFDGARWDRQIEADSNAGKLDKLTADAKAEIAAGKVRPL